MFSLTEGTLFFLDLALSTRTYDRKPSLSSVVQTWVDGVAEAPNDSGRCAGTTTGASSTLYALPPAYSSTIFQAPPTSNSRGVSIESTLQNTRMFCKTSGSPAEDGRHAVIPCHPDDGHDGETATNYHEQASVDASGMVVSFASDSDTDQYSLPSQWQLKAPRAVKRKIDDINMVLGIQADPNGDMEFEKPVPEYPGQAMEMIGSVTSQRSRIHTRPTKRIKHEDLSVSSLSASPDPTVGYVSAASMAQSQPLRTRWFDSEGYIIEAIKKRYEYANKDLPVPCDQRWFRSFLSTAILWYGAQENVWDVPEEELTSALQRIFRVVYPDIKYRVTSAGSVFALTLQRINEWRGSFGSVALAMMLHFFSTLDNNEDIHAAAGFLLTDFRFLREDPDSSEPTYLFRSPFLLILIAITHLGYIAAFVDVPGWDAQAMAAGRNGEGVIALASVALERALRFFHAGTLDVDPVLASIPRRGNAQTVMGTSTSPETMHNTLVRNGVQATSQFSLANWNGPTAVYREFARERGAAVVRDTFDAAQARRSRIAATTSDSGSGVDASSSVMA